MRDLSRVNPPAYRGSDVDDSLSVAWVSSDRARLRNKPEGAPTRAEAVPRQTQLPVLEVADVRGKPWFRVGENQWLPEGDVARPSRLPRPSQVKQGERWFDIELKTQILIAYVGDLPVFATLVSTGRGLDGSELATPKGLHRIWVKLASSDMDNLENLEAKESYAIQAVPWVMYFQKGYGLHGTFWHRAFGKVQSHGCVNLSPTDAERMFDWACLLYTSPSPRD